VPVTDDARTFAEHVVRVLEFTDEEWLDRTRRQLDYVEKNFSRQKQIDSPTAALNNARHIHENKRGRRRQRT
jgi:hypothetical protein